MRSRGMLQVDTQRVVAEASTMFPSKCNASKCIDSTLRFALAAMCALLAATGCGAPWFERTTKVDPAAVSEVRGIGKVVTQTMTDPIYEDTIQVVDILILDVAASGFEDALNTARQRLRQRGWVESVGGTDEYILMESSKWEGTTLTVGNIKKVETLGATLEPRVERALQSDPVKTGSYVVASLSSVG